MGLMPIHSVEIFFWVVQVGYTNAGKSTLLNRLSGAGVLAEDCLFASSFGSYYSVRRGMC